jgi:hypothetical protein
MAVRLTTEKERKDFLSKEEDWSYLDKKTRAGLSLKWSKMVFIPLLPICV